MSTIHIGTRRLLLIALSILAALVVLAAVHRPALAAAGHTFVLSPTDPYGASDCLGKAQGCAEVVATAWCEAHGYSAPLAYGEASDITATVAGAVPVKLDPHAYVITCGE